jgi:FKBP-type peptidyl-prolyl cis-trans isomerase
MKKLNAFFGFMIFCFSAFAQENSVPILTNEMDSVNYYLGIAWSNGIRSQFNDFNFNPDLLIKGIEDEKANSGNETLARQAQEFLNNYFSNRHEEMTVLKHKEYKEKNENFLLENKAKDSVVVLESGLQYKVLVQGSGTPPSMDDTVTVHYKGSLVDGTVFDDSLESGEPASFGVNQVIPGWTEALSHMPEGAKWIIYIPSELAYGSNENIGPIPPFSTLIFEIELLSIDSKE